jgi:uncharacterized protein
LRVWNTTRGIELGDRIGVADTGVTRRTGLLNRTSLDTGEGLWIVPCEGIHTFLMNFPIDVVFLNKHRKVVKIRKNMGKWRMSMCLRAYSVLELPAGLLEKTGTGKGDVLKFDRA